MEGSRVTNKNQPKAKQKGARLQMKLLVRFLKASLPSKYTLFFKGLLAPLYCVS